MVTSLILVHVLPRGTILFTKVAYKAKYCWNFQVLSFKHPSKFLKLSQVMKVFPSNQIHSLLLRSPTTSLKTSLRCCPQIMARFPSAVPPAAPVPAVPRSHVHLATGDLQETLMLVLVSTRGNIQQEIILRLRTIGKDEYSASNVMAMIWLWWVSLWKGF